MADFRYVEPFALAEDETPYRKLSSEHVSVVSTSHDPVPGRHVVHFKRVGAQTIPRLSQSSRTVHAKPSLEHW